MSQESLDHIVAGALYDFGGYLTTRTESMAVGAAENAVPMADALKAFLTLRRVDQSCEPFFQWPARCAGQMQPVMPEPRRPVPMALDIMRAAFAEDPHFAWTWHCNVACAVMDEGAPQDSANAAAARFMKAAFGVDTSSGPPAAPGLALMKYNR